MRYSIISKGLTQSQLETEALKIGARDVKPAQHVGQVFCELDDVQVRKLSQIPGLQIKPVKEFRAQQLLMQTALPPAESVSDVFNLLRSYFSPPLTGSGLTVAVLDSGVRKSHEALKAKVIYEANLTDSATTDDVFGHGTQVAFCVCGGIHGGKAGASPGGSVMNIKVINDEGMGTDETIALGIDAVCSMALKARTQGLYPTDEMYPNVINLSLGAPDDGDPDNPVRIACRKAIDDYGLDVIAAAGNFGPKMTTVTIPACDPEVIAVGGILTLGDIEIWEKSSRGPTVQGETKPDFVIWGTDVEMASEKADDQYVTKSGTSFASPLLAGLTGLLWESGRRAYGEAWYFRWTEARQVAPYFCTKPQDAAVNKDNAYGFGLPAMGTMLGQIAAPVSGSEQQMTEMFPMIMMMTMMAGMTGGL
jgi:serine protease AprX